MSSKTLNATDVFLRSLKELGADYIFTTPGPELASMAEAFQRGGAEDFPKPMIVPHESLAMSMAHGYFLATGKPSVVMANFNTGTANSLVHLIGAKAMNIPVLFISGRTPSLESDGLGARDRQSHWVRESFDQPSMLREYMKWDYELRQPSQMRDVLSRAWQIMTSSPQGPVALSFSREILMSAAEPGEVAMTKGLAAPVPSPSDVESVRAALRESSRPLVITSRSGLNSRTVPLLEEFAEIYQTGVICPQAQAVNIRTDHRCFLGFGDERVMREADLILVLDTDVPWIPGRLRPSAGARVIHIGPDPLFERIPLRSFQSHMNIQAGVEETLLALKTVAPPEAERSPSAWVTANREALQTALLEAPLAKFNPSAVAEILSLVLNETTVLINESSLPSESLKLEHAGTYLSTGSVVGWSMGCALGFKLGRPDSVPIAVVGDGAYYLSQPLAAQWVALARELPFLTVVMNDGHTGGAASLAKQFSTISPGLPFAAMAQAGGALGATVSTRPELKAAVDESLAAVRAGRMAVIDARV